MTNFIRDGVVEAAGLEIDFRRLELPDDLDAVQGPLFELAIDQLEQIERGEHVNSDENRQVGHFWLRNPDLAPPGLGDQIRHCWQALEAFVGDHFSTSNGRFENLLWIGIGGSALGPQMLHHALRDAATRPRMFFFDNTDPAGFRRTLDEIGEAGGLSKTLVVVVSKSGGTKETANGMQAARNEFDAAGLTFHEHAVAITVKDSQLYQAAESWLERFELWDWVGGRMSLFSAVGLLPAMAAGFDWQQFLAGARAMDDATRARQRKDNPALSLAAAWYHLVRARGLQNMVVLPYSDRLELLARYMQQLVMESLGKSGQGITVYGNKGSTDQHAFVQQLREGAADFFASFVRVLDSGAADPEVAPGHTSGDFLAAFQEGTARALSEAGRPSLRITLKSVDARSLGTLIALYERAVGFYAAMVGINAYHQPGVEAGKKAADAILKVQTAILDLLTRTDGELTVGALAEETGSDVDLVYDILDRLVTQERYGLRLATAGENPTECAFALESTP